MKFNNIQSCHLGPEISPEQFIPEHFFLFLLKGSMVSYDGYKHYTMRPGDYCIARKNHLVRYTKHKEDGAFEKVIIAFDEAFLKKFLERHPYSVEPTENDDSFLFIDEDKLIKNFVQSLEPYYNGTEQLDSIFVDIKREELLMILLKNNHELKNIFFNFSAPHKIDLELFMNHNFKFNISLERFAFMTGRSLSTFKREFKTIFNMAPGKWLIKRRLQEAYFLLDKEHKKPTEIYIDLGFEDLSHFSYVFKKQYGFSPAYLNNRSHSSSMTHQSH
ncbi:AraC family transcriptional regulator [Chryseobacterium sp. B21-037]|uniref:helix-turn-helix transcriptional regulator n=1 Tax=Chryseobacterium sp. B21-037 TaxID=2926038 RepID=UPI0023580D62|nr:helix-turn-helix domain-containing protein [Chryseobacterium sp. B21-037]MDC8104936.1 AraC family transcriptional regulator [Chryseobacterium sp. B21-037]